ncbi:serine/threonine protein kinase, partial [Micromonospora sp. S4605]
MLVALAALGAALGAAREANAPAVEMPTTVPATAPSQAELPVQDEASSVAPGNRPFRPAGSTGSPSASVSPTPSAQP